MADLEVCNVREVEEVLFRIGALSADYEAAHALQEDLYEAVLRAIRDGCENPRDMAGRVLLVKLIDFKRVFA